MANILHEHGDRLWVVTIFAISMFLIFAVDTCSLCLNNLSHVSCFLCLNNLSHVRCEYVLADLIDKKTKIKKKVKNGW